MRIGITNDHHGIKIKKEIVKYLRKKGHDVLDYGPSTTTPVDYPIYAFDIGNRIKKGEIEMGVLICGTGVGMCIAANKVSGIRCAKVENIRDAKLARQHNNANAISINSRLSMLRIKDILDTFINEKFSNEERHIRRNNMIDSYTEAGNDD